MYLIYVTQSIQSLINLVRICFQILHQVHDTNCLIHIIYKLLNISQDIYNIDFLFSMSFLRTYSEIIRSYRRFSLLTFLGDGGFKPPNDTCFSVSHTWK